jgi:hypothetical protein
LGELEDNSGSTAGGGGEFATPFGLELDHSINFDKPISAKHVDRRVCVCGHSMGSHQGSSSSSRYCINGKLWCPCEQPVPVLETDNLRHFHFRTSGWGPKHALSRGIQKCLSSGSSITPLLENNCFRCGERSVRLIPASFSRDLAILEEAGSSNALICGPCFNEFPQRRY